MLINQSVEPALRIVLRDRETVPFDGQTLMHNDQELQNHYIFTCDAVDIAVRIRSLQGSRVRDDAVIPAACRLVWANAPALYRSGYDGFPTPKDDDLLRIALAADETVHPGDYSIYSLITEIVRPIHRAPDDMILELDFVDPQVGHEVGNLILVIHRTIRLRDRVSLDELDQISAFYIDQRAKHSGEAREPVAHNRWLLVR